MIKLLNKRLKDLRKKNNVMQKEVAKVIGVSVQAYSNYELGKRFPDIDAIPKLADYFDVTTDYLLGRTNEPNLMAPPPPQAFMDVLNALVVHASEEDMDVIKNIIKALLAFEEDELSSVLDTVQEFLELAPGDQMQFVKPNPSEEMRNVDKNTSTLSEPAIKILEGIVADLDSNLAALRRQMKRTPRNHRSGRPRTKKPKRG